MYLSAEKLKSGALLAPMAGVADRSMRELCMKFGAIGCIGEMASSKGISMNDRKSSELLSLSDAERPAGVQIFGDVPEIMAKAIETCMKYSPDFIDINMGCPAPKVAGNGGGSALMKRPELAAEIVAQCVKVSPVPITVKMRAGWDAEIFQRGGTYFTPSRRQKKSADFKKICRKSTTCHSKESRLDPTANLCPETEGAQNEGGSNSFIPFG